MSTETYLTDYTCSLFRQSGRALPEPRVKAVFRAGYRDGVRPGISSQNRGERRVVDFGNFCDASHRSAPDSTLEIADINSDGFIGGVIQRAQWPVSTELVRFWSFISTHTPSLPDCVLSPRKKNINSWKWYDFVRNYAQKDATSTVQKYNPTAIPSKNWETIKPLVIETVTDYRTANPTLRETTDVVTYTAHLIYWTTAIAGYPFDKSVIFDRDTIAYYITYGCSHLRANTRSTRRSLLLRVAEATLPPQERVTRLTKIHEDTPLAPYTSEDILNLRGWAENQPTETKRITCRALLALGLGAGLNTHDILHLKARDIHVDNIGVLIQVRNNKSCRDIPVLATWEQPLIDILTLRQSDDWVLGIHRTGRRNSWMSSYLAKCTPYKDVQPKVGRMRNTWIFHHMLTGTPIGPLTYASGLETFRTIEKLIPFLPEESIEQVRHSMRNAVRISS